MAVWTGSQVMITPAAFLAQVAVEWAGVPPSPVYAVPGETSASGVDEALGADGFGT